MHYNYSIYEAVPTNNYVLKVTNCLLIFKTPYLIKNQFLLFDAPSFAALTSVQIQICSKQFHVERLYHGRRLRGTGGRSPKKFEVGDDPCIRPPIFREPVRKYEL